MSRKIFAVATFTLIVAAAFLQGVISLVAQQPALSAKLEFHGEVTDINHSNNMLIVSGHANLSDISGTANTQFKNMLGSQAWVAKMFIPIQTDNQGNPIQTEHAWVQVTVQPHGQNNRVINFVVTKVVITDLKHAVGSILDLFGDADTPSDNNNTQPTDDFIIQTLEAEITPFGPEDFLLTIDAMDTQFPKSPTPGNGMPTGQPTVAPQS